MSAPQEAVIEFGPAGEPAPRRRFSPGSSLGGLVRDRRIAPLAAGLGGVALFASLIAEWQVTAVDGTVLRESDTGDLLFESSIGELGGWGAGFLAGLFLLVIATVLTLFGPAAGRAYTRLAGLSTGGVLLAIVLVVYSTLEDRSWVIRQIEAAGLSENDDQLHLSIGRGPWCAGVGLILLLIALCVAGLAAPRAPVVDLQPQDDLPDEPFELQVTSAKTWDAPAENRDKPISR
ncbi:hypothetical protein [Actinoplanes sp. TFC3]|uniref:hypothetical protein n=1 Tax=Actinoplanes sp. TFC3 TaxID=1710355 RepID=UPI0008375354|nr:hypothetical protein [Actinoplanes sp. TFC3]